MKKIQLIVLILFFSISACAPSGTPTLSSTQAEATFQQPPVENTVKPTQAEATLPVPPTATIIPTPIPTQVPVLFNQTGYRQFAVTRDYFPGLQDFMNDRSYDTFIKALSPSGDQFAMAGCYGSVTNTVKCETSKSGFLVVLDSNNGNLLNEIPLGETWPGSVDFTSDGKSLLYATNEFKIGLWELGTNEPGLILFTEPAPDTNYYPDVTASPDGRSLSAVVDETLYVWDPAGELLLQVPAYKLMFSAGLEYSENGSYLTVFSPEHVGVDIYDTNNWTLVRRILTDQIQRVAISPDGKFVAATNSEDDTAAVWDVKSGDQIASLDPGNWAESIQFNPTGDLLIISGMGNLETQDSYSNLGAVYETQTWTLLDTLYTFTGEGSVEFNRDGSRMAVFGFMGPAMWGLPDDNLKEGFEVVKQFQEALGSEDYDTAASLFEARAGEEEYLAELGLDLADLPASFERLCNSQVIFCYPVHDLMMMGNSWDTMVYLVRLEDSNGEVFTSPKGAHIIYFYLYSNAEGEPRVSYPPKD